MSLVEALKGLAAGAVSSQEYCMAALAQAAKFKSYNIFTLTSPTYVRDAAAAVDTELSVGLQRLDPSEFRRYCGVKT